MIENIPEIAGTIVGIALATEAILYGVGNRLSYKESKSEFMNYINSLNEPTNVAVIRKQGHEITDQYIAETNTNFIKNINSHRGILKAENWINNFCDKLGITYQPQKHNNNN